MRRLTIVLLLITNILCNLAIVAQATEIAPVQKESGVTGKIVTAIDAAEAIFNGSSDAALAALLSERREGERGLSPPQGSADKADIQSGIDEDEAIRRIIEGNQYSQEARYGQAAREYTLAMQFSPKNYAPYKLRADSYLQYLLVKSQDRLKNMDAAQQKLFDRTRTLLCKAINADYAQALALNDAIRKSNSAYLLSKKTRLGEKDQESEPTSYYEKGKGTTDKLVMRRIYQTQRKAIQTDGELKKSLANCRTICEMKEDAVR